MNKEQFASALSVAILVYIWVWLGPVLGLSVWIGFVAWATFFAAGAQYSTVKIILPTFIMGAVLGYLSGQVIVITSSMLGGVAGPLFSAVTAFIIMVLMVTVPSMAFAPAMFLGWASFVGSGFNFWNTFISLLVGILLGILSISLPMLVVRKDK